MFAERLVPDERINDFLQAVVNELGLELFQYIYGETHESLDKAIQSVSYLRCRIDLVYIFLYIFFSLENQRLLGRKDFDGNNWRRFWRSDFWRRRSTTRLQARLGKPSKRMIYFFDFMCSNSIQPIQFLIFRNILSFILNYQTDFILY